MAAETVLLIVAILLAWTYLLWPATVIALAAVKRRTAGKDDAQNLAHKWAENKPQAQLQTRPQGRTGAPHSRMQATICSSWRGRPILR